MNLLRGTEPLGVQPPLMRHPMPSWLLIVFAASKSFSGVSVGCIVSKSFPPQCLQFNAQLFPVTENVGKQFFEGM